MGYYVVVGGEDWHDLATITGLSQMREWTDKLPVEKYPELIHLLDHGFSQKLDALAAEIVKAVKAKPPKSDVATIIKQLQAALADRKEEHESIVLTDGLTSKEHPGGEWEIPEEEEEAEKSHGN